jgi:3alpha(or 20beta)-hydroxysteroid dehydrogenase
MSSSDVLAGKVAVISGGARGQGAEEGRLFHDAGATVLLADVLDSDGYQAATKLGVSYTHLDVTSEEEWDTVMADVVRTHGSLDVMVNNAGILRHNQLVDETLEQWQQVISVNQTGVFLGMRAAAKAMIAAGNGGSIINISSLAGLRGTPGSMSYCASKWAVRGMTKVAARELGRYGIRVNSIHPGVIVTDMMADSPLIVDDARQAERLRSTPLGRLGTSTDVATVALFLASEASGYCTGQEFVVDGGVHS